jgi:hypothetical protein
MSGPTFLSDEPTLTDLLDHTDIVRQVGETAAGCQPPCVLGVHGDWGSGKTSFLHALHYYLAGECSPLSGPNCGVVSKEKWPGWAAKEHVAVIWFEAWRYQQEPAPVVALLHEIRAQLPTASKLFDSTKKLGEVAIKSALFGMEWLTKRIGLQASKVQEIGEKWEKEHFAEQLPSHTLRQFLADTVERLLPEKSPDPAAPIPRIVVLIDDLDRCEPQAAYRLLEGIKIYLNLPNCVFVLGVNQAVIEVGLAEQIAKEKAEKPGEEARQRARDYMDKICKNYWHLPACQDIATLVNRWLTESLKQSAIYGMFLTHIKLGPIFTEHRCLPANPRRIKAFVNTLARFLISVAGRKNPLPWPAAEVCVVLAYLYLFHPEIYRVIEWEPTFYQELRNWCERPSTSLTSPPIATTPPSTAASPSPTASPVHELFRSLARPHEPISDPSAATPATSPGRPTFPDPARGNVFRMQSLVRSLGDFVTTALIKDCLLR